MDGCPRHEPGRGTRTGRWRRAVGAVAVAGLVVVAGCARPYDGELVDGDLPEVPDAPDEAEALLLDAVERTRAVGSADLTSTIDLGLGAVEVDWDLTPGGVGEVSGTLRFGQVVTFEVRSDGTTAWIRTDDPDVLEQLPPGVSWVEGTRDEILADISVSDLDGWWSFLLFLRGAESIDAGGIASVEGVDVRMVSGAIDREAARDAATAAEQELMDKAYHSSATDERFEFELGIDGDRRIRSLAYTITPLDDDGLGLPARLGIEVRRFDQEVEVPEPPPADETVSVDDIPGGLEALNDDD